MKVRIKIQDDNNNTVKFKNEDFKLVVNSGIDLTTLIDVIFKNGYNVLIKEIKSDEED